MKVTVCELNDTTQDFEKDWEELVEHCSLNKSELVLLPEMPFYPWIANQITVDDKLRSDPRLINSRSRGDFDS